jgi:glycylpeptide N-tetradecanoyltransferase
VFECADVKTISGKNEKDIGTYKFWNTQPVPKFNEPVKSQGPIHPPDLSKVPAEPAPLIADFEWVTVDLENTKELEEVYQLLSAHYVEDKEAMFRFNYSPSFLNWALKSPGWKKEWHIGVRVKSSKKLVAFISGIPLQLRLRKEVVSCSEINFLCVHKKLRAKRLAPVLITEVTRRCNQAGIWQALYSAGKLLPTPIAACRYFHRSLNWTKLHEVGFSPMPPGSSVAKQLARFALPKETVTEGLREMKTEDVPAVTKLLQDYLKKFDMAQEFTEEDVTHWILPKDQGTDSQVVWTYVVEVC